MKSSLILLVLMSLMVSTLICAGHVYTPEKAVRIIGEKSGVWPIFNLTQQELANMGFPIKVKNPVMSMPIYPLSGLGEVLAVVEYDPEINRAPAVLYLINQGPLRNTDTNKTLMITQTQVIVYDENAEELQLLLINPWRSGAVVARHRTFNPA